MLERVFFFSAQSVQFYHWRGKHCQYQQSFNLQEDQAELLACLRRHQNIPARLLLDCAEEDFRSELLPGMYGVHRKAILARYQQRLFANSDWVSVSCYKASADRKEQQTEAQWQCLFTAVHKSRALEQFLTLLENSGTILSGIWSVALLSGVLLARLGIKGEKLLLITQQTSGYVRQTYFYSGRVQFSRLSYIANSSESDLLTAEIDKTLRFLIKQHYLAYNELLDIHTFLAPDDVQIQMGDHPVFSHKTDALWHTPGICNKPLFADKSAAMEQIFSYFCSIQKPAKRHYTETKILLFWRQYCWRKSLYGSSVAILGIALLFSVYIGHIVSISKEKADKLHATGILSVSESVKNQDILLQEGSKMREAVLMGNYLQDAAQKQPHSAWKLLSGVLVSEKFKFVIIDRMLWHRQKQNTDVQDSPEMGSANTSASVLLHLEGRLLAANDLRSGVQIMQDFLQQLRMHQEVLKVEVVQMPLDMRVTQTLKRSIRLDSSLQEQQQQNSGKFVFRIWLR